MEADKLKKIEEIFHAALKVPPEKLESFLLAQCGSDEKELRREVESLLSFEKTFDSFIDSPHNIVFPYKSPKYFCFSA